RALSTSAARSVRLALVADASCRAFYGGRAVLCDVRPREAPAQPPCRRGHGPPRSSYPEIAVYTAMICSGASEKGPAKVPRCFPLALHRSIVLRLRLPV